MPPNETPNLGDLMLLTLIDDTEKNRASISKDEMLAIISQAREANALRAEVAALRAELAHAKQTIDTLRSNYAAAEGAMNTAVRDTLDLREENARLAEALLSISEYWNGFESERVMKDACEYAEHTATAALQPAPDARGGEA